MNGKFPSRFADGDYVVAESNHTSQSFNVVPEFSFPGYRGHFHAILNPALPGSPLPAKVEVRNTGLADFLDETPASDAGTLSVFWQEVHENETSHEHTSVTRCHNFTLPALPELPLSQSGWLILRMLRNLTGSYSFSDAKLGTINLDFDWIVRTSIPVMDSSHAYLVVAAVRVDKTLRSAEVIQQQYGPAALPLPLTPGDNSDSSSSASSSSASSSSGSSSSGGPEPWPWPWEDSTSISESDPVPPPEDSTSESDPVPPPEDSTSISGSGDPAPDSSSSLSGSSSSSVSSDGFFVSSDSRIVWIFTGKDETTNDLTVYAEGILETAGACRWEDDGSEYFFPALGAGTSLCDRTALEFQPTVNRWAFRNSFFVAHQFPGAQVVDVNTGEVEFFLPKKVRYRGSYSNTIITIEFSLCID